MDPKSLLGLAQVLLFVVLVLAAISLYLITRWKDVDPFKKWNRNSINGFLFILFGVVSVIVAAIASNKWDNSFILVYNSASEHGVHIDRMFWNSTWVSIFVVLLTHVLLFYYGWKYRGREGNKAFYYPHNNTLELIWTIVPALVLAILIFDGVTVWHNIFADAPKNAIQIELNAKQFDWTIRYTGNDSTFGKAHVQYIDEADGNQLGFDFSDKTSHDDIVTQEVHLPVGVPARFTIKSRDVLHSATMPHFRMKMDAVPGMPTYFWMTPTKTTKEMQEITGNPDFEYEMSCQQICGGGHWNMRRVVIVESMEEYQAWLAEQKPYYALWKEMNGIEDEAAPAKEAAPVNEEPVKDVAEQIDATENAISMN